MVYMDSGCLLPLTAIMTATGAVTIEGALIRRELKLFDSFCSPDRPTGAPSSPIVARGAESVASAGDRALDILVPLSIATDKTCRTASSFS